MPHRPLNLFAPQTGPVLPQNLFTETLPGALALHPPQLPAAMRAAVDAAAEAAGFPALRGIDEDALMQLALQRTGSVPGAAIKAWAAGDDAPLRAEIRARGAEILSAALAEVKADAEALAPHLTSIRGGTLVDIGCGHGLVAAWLTRLLAPKRVVLIDIEDSDHRGHFWGNQGAGYSSLSLAARLVRAEGARPIPVNPQRDPLPQGGFEGAISVLSCGFHYPVDDYAAWLADGIRPGGVVALDLRARKADAAMDALVALSRIASAQEIGRTRKVRRTLFRRNATPT